MMKKCVCPKCRNPYKDISNFGKDRKSRDGLYRYCRECVSEKFKLYREKNKRKLVLYSRKWRKRNRRLANSLSLIWYRKNREKRISAHKIWTKNNIEKRRKYEEEHRRKMRSYYNRARREWNKNNPERLALTNINRRIKRNHRICMWNTEKENEMIKLFYYNCPKGMVVDHIIPLCGKTVSGLHRLSNLQYLTQKENNLKRDIFDPNKYPEQKNIKAYQYD